ncbi:acetyltransferase [Microbacterium sp. HD4P20]|uniref:acyltransferase family protein n=1 Tax=Microbacterium sp. HD4P20 TaxID=2864874 RepID=UPI001C644A45|nr:acyltransferase family protein [Microbacterium sp. HD4P20]MCP2638082.1 acetyltransferase [Microbacterium sp. HD4P20]
MTSNAPAERPARYRGLDGLRAIAVTLVVVYHLFPPALLPGGFVGVDVFFVISGFLITSLLLREHDATGRVGLRAFWQRRARRLLPALALVVVVCSTLAWLIGGDVLVHLGAQVLGAATFSYNWVSIAAGSGYFAAATPELFRNFWSLAVEEQFYVLWPLLFPIFLLLPRAWARVGVALALATASAVWMGTAVDRGDDLTRAYFGTDTHAFGLLLGVGLAFLLAPMLARPPAPPAPASPSTAALAPGWMVVIPRFGGGTGPVATEAPPSVARVTRPAWVDAPRARLVTGIAGILAILGVVAVSMLPPVDSAATFPGALLVASVLTAVAITAGVWPGSWFGPAIDVAPLRWIGDRSYGIYLWHWPLLVLAVAAFAGTGTSAGVPVWIGLGVLAATAVASALSYRFVEMPVRRRGLRGSARVLAARLRSGPRARIRAIGVALAGVVFVAGTGAAIAAAPAASTSEAVVAAGRHALEQAQREAEIGGDPGATATPDATETADATATPGATEAPGASGEPGATDAADPAAVHVSGDRITAVGDSVMLASARGLLERLPGIAVDAEVSRSIWAGPGILDSLAAGGVLRPYVVVALGTNGPVNIESLERMAAAIGPERHLVLVNAYAPRDWIPGVNADLQAFADARHNVSIADWSGAISARVDLLAGDHVHPGGEGGRLFAETIADAVDAAERDHLERRANAIRRIESNLGIDLTP